MNRPTADFQHITDREPTPPIESFIVYVPDRYEWYNRHNREEVLTLAMAIELVETLISLGADTWDGHKNKPWGLCDIVIPDRYEEEVIPDDEIEDDVRPEDYEFFSEEDYYDDT